MTARYLIGDVFDRMAELENGSIDLILTSPPFLALRSYLPADHPDKAKEIGSEPTPAEFIDTLLALTAEWRRLLAPHGSICVELGDTYSGSGGAGGDYNDGSLRDGQPRFDGSAKYARTHDPDKGPPISRVSGTAGGGGGTGWPMPKSLALVPEAYRMALAYGRNPHTGTKSPAGQWRIRNVIRWVRPNPPVGALGDKFRPATSEMVVATIAGDRYFDLDAVRGEPSPNTHARVAQGAQGRTDLPSQQRDGNWHTLEANNDANPAGAPPLDWWKISPGGYPGSHYAVFPPELCVKPIKAMCPERVCRECGEPSRRIVETQRTLDGEPVEDLGAIYTGPNGMSRAPQGVAHWRFATERTEIGWTDCGHDAWRPGIVLDPFAGSGTTLAVATGHGRDAIGIDIDERNAELALDRVGPLMLEVA